MILVSNWLIGQVTSVNYQMKYDTSSCLYDVYIIINSGSATTIQQRIQFNSACSIVTPFGSSLSIAQTHAPFVSNANEDSTTPISWGITSSHNYPAVGSDRTFYSIVPAIHPVGHYNSVNQGDTIKIFSLSITPTADCASNIRLWENGVDPSSSDPDMAGLDFNNGFTIGSAIQRYNANSTQVYPPKPLLVDAIYGCSEGIEIDLSAETNTCQSPLSFSWSGPNSFTASTEDISISPSSETDNGVYKVVVTDGFGCQDSIMVNAVSKPNAGVDQSMCASATDTLFGLSPTSGTWSALSSNNPGVQTITNIGLGRALVSFNESASGTYAFIYTIPGCSDTMSVTVDPIPMVSVSGNNQICTSDSTTLSPSTGGTWISNNPLVASVEASTGKVHALQSGTATFTFTASSTGCSATTDPVTVNPKPTVTNVGSDTICIGNTTSLTPATGGNWTSDDPAIASISGIGVVTGVAEGTADFLFEEIATGCVSDTIKVTVEPRPVISISGNDSICVFSTTQMSPSTGGTWVSSNTLIASINNSGLVTGLQSGKVVVTYTSTSSQCVSLPSDSITVVSEPSVGFSGDDRICIGVTTTLFPNSGGLWTSSNESVATVNPTTGVVTSVGPGIAVFQFTDNATGCSNTTSALVVDPKPTVSTNQTNICLGSSTSIFPSSGGTWTNHTPLIASLSLTNQVTGLTTGTAKLTFLEQGTNCESDTIFIVVEPGPVVSISGADEICVGLTSQLAPSTGGTWISSDPNIASVNNSGLVTGVAAGSVTFTFTSTSTFCTSSPTDPITVIPRPIITLSDSDVCVDNTTNILPSSGGTWVSSNSSIATISNSGLITGVAAGVVTLTYTDTSTGCTSSPSSPLTVNAQPISSFSGPTTICVGANTSVSPSIGGTWQSSDPSVATVTNSGVVTAIGSGTAQLVFVQTASSCIADALEVTVIGQPSVSITGDTLLCIGETTTLSPTSGGVWVSNDPSVATVENDGTVTAVNQGTTTFVFTSNSGCPSNPSRPITVNGFPPINITGDDNICVGDTGYLSPTTTGVWTSSDPAIAQVLIDGKVLGVSAGTATFTFVDTLTGCTSDGATSPLLINANPAVNTIGPSNICVGATTNLVPTTGGTWQSNDLSIATVNNAGLVTGIATGGTTFVFTNSSTGCVSDASDSIFVTPGPTVLISGDDQICVGETTTLNPTTGGTWASSNELVATISNAGVVTGVSAGSVTFVFTENGSGCTSEDSDPIIIHGKPSVIVDGPTTICKGGTTSLLPNTGGSWVSSNDNIATVNNAGLVTGVEVGSASFIFTLAATGCSSDATLPVSVSPAPTAEITGDTIICIGSYTTLSPTIGGIWTSNNPSIATVTNDGIVTAIAPGKTTFTFVETATGCPSETSTRELEVENCLNPDFNSTFVDVLVNGNSSTNDFVDVSTTYGPTAQLTSSPSGSVANISVNSDGTYSFSANTIGVYTYEIPVCVPPYTTGCPTSLLTIYVLDYLLPDRQPVANIDIGTTLINTAITLHSLENDRCVVVTGCSLDSTSVTLIDPPSNGAAIVNAINGNITYTPSNGYIGKDTLKYQVCTEGDLTNCASAIQIITINDLTAENTTSASDDYAVGPEGVVIEGNVSINDSDAEGDVQSVTSQNISVPEGTFVLGMDGAYVFTPSDNFYGPIDFVYTICDDNIEQACADATLHILVIPDLTVKVMVYLEGALMSNGGEKGTTHTRPLMRDNLRVSPFNGSNYIPIDDPYQVSEIDEGLGSSYFTGLPTKYEHKASGDSSIFLTISDPTTVFSKVGEDAIVDWVFVELRSKSDSTIVLASRSGLLQRDGDVVDLDGSRGLRFSGMKMDSYYVSVKHRNHLGVMTEFAQTPEVLTDKVDFTSFAVPIFDFGFVDYGSGVTYDFTDLGMKANPFNLPIRALWAGDFDGNSKVKAANPGDDLNVVFFDVFSHANNTTFKANFDFAYGYRNADFDLNAKVKFDNPNDDKNMLFGQVLFFPLNTQFLSNFDFFIEQLPE